MHIPGPTDDYRVDLEARRLVKDTISVSRYALRDVRR
jgi:hypothetical protein